MITKQRSARLMFVLLFLISVPTFGQVRLPRLISDGMVLQRDARVNLWGWAGAHEKLSIAFCDSVYRTSANEKGLWVRICKSDTKNGRLTFDESPRNCP